MSTNYSLLFYLKKPKNYVNGPRPIYMRITVDGIPKEISTGRECDPSKWNSKANRMKGTTEAVKIMNSFLDTLVSKVSTIHTAMTAAAEEITAESIKLRYQGKDIKQKQFLDVFREHNIHMEALLGNGFKPNTLKGYKTSLSHFEGYLEKEFRLADIDTRKIDHAFVTGYEFFLRSTMGCSAVSAAKYMKHLRKIIKICIAHRWITDDPFAFYKIKAKAKEKEFLTDAELRRIEEKLFKIPRLAHVRDIFVFCCYTGLSYADVKKLKWTDIAEGVDGKLWIFTSREKTETSSNIPLLPKALEIIERYRDYPPCVSKDMVLPVLSNQKMNSYLKEIADLCEITKELTFHKSRHTFATSVTLANSVPIETVSKMLGHTDIKTTQHYAKLLDNRVAIDMERLERKIESRPLQLKETVVKALCAPKAFSLISVDHRKQSIA
ncbi:MAG TPA: recombinase [Sphingobacterium sp.]|uniref:site-specific integrase n=1 Tax=Sphingobacterium sp. UBA2610 TaxID=1947491 RepID=UPI000E949D58|nr:site-specific integrase [Sphingobacterium sp. UBA2610]HAU52097.1 recombinase [Sphingobacterium sp.]HCX56432.1 recombinase [Sphingobacterium sp.]